MKRMREYDSDVSERLLKKGIRYRQQYFLTLMDGGDIAVEEALRIFIQRVGVSEFAELVTIPQGNISRFLSRKHRVKAETLDAFLKPFGLKTKITVEQVASVA